MVVTVKPARRPPQDPGDKPLTRVDVAARLGVSTSTVRRYEGDLLHPTKGVNGVNQFDAAEIAALAVKLLEQRSPKAKRWDARSGGKRTVPERTAGDIASEVFERLEQRQSLAEIVVGLRVAPAVVRELHREWQRGLVEGELEREQPVLPAGQNRRARERVVDEPTLAALIAALPRNSPTRISAARDFGTEEEIDAGPVRRIVELGGFVVHGPFSTDELVDRYGPGAFRVTAYGLDPRGVRWEVLATILRPGANNRGR